ncbi:conserved protein of unknown function [Oenococcus oeni]|uniref:hypothetical protein n=1 Tax=Oenococcus oeni TaxID=1247 RepID=UPI00107D5EA0|nr:hypothetical protein [Oenococcus oeni]AVI94113.1 hypothetical protein AX764_04375 [Oenococcus oeni]SYV99685.1 conserved hypothetical protein [Oenococcus oeni]SYW03861.1 conserved hypothetical protein [Oenococcus oeni]SYW17642.1 conserved hypothetical protein [Oenococcus oeni]VDC14633.1 conserved protein of unknown function [Oenococcus oeni]
MTINMYQADRNFVSPANDAALYSAILNNQSGLIPNRGNSFALSVDGLVASVDTGQAVVAGRLVEITAIETITLPANSSGYVCLVVDLKKTNDVTGTAGSSNYAVAINQVYLAVVTGTLTQNDLNNGGSIYELPIASFTSTASTASLTKVVPNLNDTGWQKLSTVPNLVFGASSFAQYRVKAGVMYLRWRGLDTSKTTNSNQIGTVPAAYKPDIEFSSAAIDDSSGTPYALIAHVNTNGTLYVNYVSPHNGGISGLISYPI